MNNPAVNAINHFDPKKFNKSNKSSPGNKIQVPPLPNGNEPIIQFVIEDLASRQKVGFDRYGTPLQAFNGRDALVDLYQELLDAVLYARQRIEEDRELSKIQLKDNARRSYLQTIEKLKMATLQLLLDENYTDFCSKEMIRSILNFDYPSVLDTYPYQTALSGDIVRMIAREALIRIEQNVA